MSFSNATRPFTSTHFTTPGLRFTMRGMPPIVVADHGEPAQPAPVIDQQIQERIDFVRTAFLRDLANGFPDQ